MISCQRSKLDHMIFCVKANFKEGIPCCYVRRQDIDGKMQSKLPQRRFMCYFGWIDGKCLMIFLLMKINQLDIKRLIKDCFGLVILQSLKFLKPFLNMISERVFIMNVQYFGIPRTCTCVT